MTPDAQRRMDVYQEGQRAYLSGADCPYTDWRAKTWAKGRAAAEAYYTAPITEEPQGQDVCPCCGSAR